MAKYNKVNALFFLIIFVLVLTLYLFVNELSKTDLETSIETNPIVEANSAKKSVYTAVDVVAIDIVDLSQSPPSQIDGITTQDGLIVLIRNNPTNENGIYTITNNSWVRSAELTDQEQVVEGGLIYVRLGTVHGDSTLQLKVTSSSSNRLLQSSLTTDSITSGLFFDNISQSVLPTIEIDDLQVLSATNKELHWSLPNGYYDQTIHSNVFTNSNIEIDTNDNLSNVKTLHLLNDDGTSTIITTNPSATIDTEIQLPNNIPTVGNSLVVNSINLGTNEIEMVWGEPVANVVEQVVTVSTSPGIGEFNSVSLAIDSIVDASVNKPYVISIEPGQYNEDNIVMKEFVSLKAVDKNSCFINGGSVNNVITASDNSGISNVSITSTQISGSNLCGILITDKTNFVIQNVSISDCANAVSISATTKNCNITIFDLTIENAIDKGIQTDNSTAFELIVDIFSIRLMCTNISSPVGICASGDNTIVNIHNSTIRACNSLVGTGLQILAGAQLNILSCTISNYLVAISVPIQSDIPKLVIIGSYLNNNTTDLSILDTTCQGYIDGLMIIDKSIVSNASPFFTLQSESRTISVALKGGNFSSLFDAITYINTLSEPPSITNPITITIGSGVFSEIDVILPQHVVISGLSQDTSFIEASSTASTFITANQYTSIRNLSITVGSGSSIGILYEGGEPVAVGTTLENVNIIGQDINSTLIYLNSDFGSQSTITGVASNLTHLNNVKFFGLFGYGIDMNNTLGINVSAIVNNLEWLNPSSTTISQDVYCFRSRGVESTVFPLGANTNVIVGTNVIINDSRGETVEAKVIAFKNESYINLSLSGGTLGNLLSSIEGDNAVSDQLYRIRNVLIANKNNAIATSKIEINHISATGFINCICDPSFITLQTNDISVNLIDPDSGNTSISGDLFLGNTFNTLTNVTHCIDSVCNIGLYNGGGVSYPVQPDLTNFTIDIGSGYIVDITTSTINFLEWETPFIVTLLPNQSSWIYIDSSGTIVSDQTTLPTVDTSYILIGRVKTDATSIVYYQNLSTETNQLTNQLNDTKQIIFGPLFSTGVETSVNGTIQLDVASGRYFYGSIKYEVTGGTAISFIQMYNNGTTILPSANVVNVTQYDNAGTLTAIPSGEFARHALYVVNGGSFEQYFFIFATSTNIAKIDIELPEPPSFFGENVALIASIITQEGVTFIEGINDERPRPAFVQSSITGGTAVDHQSLSNRDDITAHAQYLLKGGDSMTGTLDLNSNLITNATSVNGVVVESISTRLVPGGLDALPTSAPVAIELTNNIGTSSTFARADHRHAHGDLSGGTLHASVTGVSNGFMLSTDKTKLDNSNNVPTASSLVEWDASKYLHADQFVTTGDGKLVLNNSVESFQVTLQALSGLSQNVNITLPSSTGTSDQYLRDNGSGVLSWISNPLLQVRTSYSGNINAVAVTPVEWTVTPDFIDSNFTIEANNSDITINTTGRYEVYTNLIVTSTVQRCTCFINFYKNGSVLKGQSTTGYIRAQSGHNTSSGSLKMIYDFVASDVISVRTQQEALVGTATLISEESVFSIKGI